MPSPNSLRTPDAPELPLAGTRVLDLTRALAGPFCTTLIADLGADVIKVEPYEGEMMRDWGPFDDEVSLYFVATNRNKRSLALDLRSAEGRDILRRLACISDVLVENFRPGILDRLGLDEVWLKDNAPELVVMHMSGFGPYGPLSDLPCFDQIAQGVGGLMSVTGTEDTGPLRSGVPLADMLCGMFAATAICAAMVRQSRTGTGTTLSTSLLESVMGVLSFQAQRVLNLGEVPGPSGNDHPSMWPYGVFATGDGDINLAVGTQDQWIKFCHLLGQSDWLTKPGFVTAEDRYRNKPAVRAALEQALQARSGPEWVEQLRAAGVPAGPINDIGRALEEPQVKALHLVNEVDHPQLGRTRVMRPPFHVDGEALRVRRHAPILGEHSYEIAREAGLDNVTIDALIRDKLIKDGRTEDKA